MSRRTVLHLVGNLDLGGGQKLTALVAESLPRDRFDVTVACLGNAGPYADRLRTKGIPVIELGFRQRLSVADLPRNVVATFRLWSLLLVRRRRWDIVHTHMFLTAALATVPARLRGSRVFGTSHRVYYRRQAIVDRLLSRIQERVVVDSEAVGEILAAATGVARDRLAVIHNGIDTDEFDDVLPSVDAKVRLGLPSDALVVGEVAHLAPHKGQRHLIDAFAALVPDHPCAHLLLVGDGPDAVALMARIDELGVKGRASLLGARSDLPQVLAAIDVLVLVSTYEGFGIVQAEAMYLEKPVVAGDHGGSTEVVADDVTGYLVAFGDVAGLETRLRELLADPDLRQRLGAAGRRRVEQRFTAQQMGAAYAALYEGVRAAPAVEAAGPAAAP